MRTNEPGHNTTQLPLARRVLALLFVMPLINSVSAAAMGFFVVYSDADDYKVLAGVLSAANVGGWLWWIVASFQQLRASIQAWVKTKQSVHPGFRLAELMSLGGAVCWVGVLCLLAYGMLG